MTGETELPSIKQTVCTVQMNMCGRILDRIFEDKRIAIFILMIWLITVLVVFKDIGLLETGYMNFGPSSQTKFMGVVLDTWSKWALVASFTFVNTCINDFMSDAISPWILNTITDHKTRYLPYSKYVCLMVTQSWAIYCNIMSVFGMMIALSQIDFVMIRMGADLIVNTYTNLKFMRNKISDPHKYYSADNALEEGTPLGTMESLKESQSAGKV